MSEVKKQAGELTRTRAAVGAPDLKVQQLFKAMVENNASDLHITNGNSPCIRVSGAITKIKTPPLTPDDTKRLIYQILTEEQKNEFEKNMELDFSFGIKDDSIFPESSTALEKIRGLDVTICTSAKNNAECKALLESVGFPFVRQGKVG